MREMKRDEVSKDRLFRYYSKSVEETNKSSISLKKKYI